MHSITDHAKGHKSQRLNKDSQKGKWFRKVHKKDRTREQKKATSVVNGRTDHDIMMRDMDDNYHVIEYYDNCCYSTYDMSYSTYISCDYDWEYNW